MKKFTTALVASALFFGSSVANADIATWFSETEIAANVRLASDYQFYGASQTSGADGNDPGASIQGGFDITWATLDFIGADLYSGLFAANVEWGRGTNDPAGIEFTHYHGIAGEFGDSGISWDIGGINYTYPDQDADAGFSDDFDYWEVYGVFGYSFADVMFEPTVSVGYYYSPEWFGFDDKSHHIPVSVDFSLPYGIGLNVFFGNLYVDFSAANLAAQTTGASGTADEYQYFGGGISYTALGIDFDASYTAISRDDDCALVQTGNIGGSQCGGFIFGMSKSF